jgi:hypothetical protein
MNIRKRLNESLGLTDTIDEEKKRFVHRVNQSILYEIEKGRFIDYQELFKDVCFDLGVNAYDLLTTRGYGAAYGRRLLKVDPDSLEAPPLRVLTKDDFQKTLETLCSICFCLDADDQKWLSHAITTAMSLCTCDIGVRWREGLFYQSGAEELDKHLIEENLTWLKDYPAERQDYRRALECYFKRQSLTDVVKNCYSAVEGLVRTILGNRKTLDKNKELLLKQIRLSEGWKSILANYINYVHDYRHASPDRHKITGEEAEACLYMTGLIIRLVIESKC